jgi:putative SOS response-associated peptidase YedK
MMFEALDTTASGVAIDYNVAPTDPVPVVRNSQTMRGRVLAVARWGLLPPWATDRRAASRMINARAETVATSRAFARPFATNRCLIPAAGWYEFGASTHPGIRKQPYFMTHPDGSPVVFGGIWSMWTPPEQPDAEDGRILTCSIVTTAAIGPLQGVHDRMPLILDRERWSDWLSATTDLPRLLTPPTDAQIAALEIRPVGPAVGDVRNDGPSLVSRVDVPRPPVDSTLF